MSNDIAQRMYGTPAPSAAPASTPPPPATLAQRMYGGTASASAGNTVMTGDTTAALASTPVPATPNAEADKPKEPTPDAERAERMYEAAALVGDSPQVYAGIVLGPAFDNLEYQARSDRNEEDIQALAAGRHDAAALMHEMGVPLSDAKAVAGSLGSWATQRLDGQALATAGERAEATLRGEWGADYERNVDLARTAYKHALNRLPWLADMAHGGAGNDPAVIKHFAKIGRRMTRKAG